MAFVISDGALRTLSVQGIAGVRNGMTLADDYSPDYAAIWRGHGSVRTVVDFLGRNIASLGLHLFRRKGDNDRERVTDHPLARLLGRPNIGTTFYRMMDGTVRDLAIFDRAYWLKLKAVGGGFWVVRLPAASVVPKQGTWFGPDHFELHGSTGVKKIPADQIVNFRGYAPEGDLAGTSPLESLRRVLAEEYEAGRMREQTLRNGARASGYLERPAPQPGQQAWSDVARDRFRQSWRAQYSGGGPEAGGTPILEDGMKFVPASHSARDLQYVEVRKLAREEVAAAYFIPPTMVGIMESATFSNIKEQHKHLYQDTLGPWLSMISQELMLQLLPEFEDTADLYLEFNLEEKLRGSFEEQAAQLQAATGGPWMTRNEARAMRNLPAIEGGDELIVPLNVIEGGQASPQDSAPPLAGAAAAPRREVKANDWVLVKGPGLTDSQKAAAVALFENFFKRQKAVVLSAIGAGGAWWDADRWNGELADDLFALSLSMSSALGSKQAEALGFDPTSYDVDRTLEFLKAVAASRAEWVNEATRSQLEEAVADESEDAPGPASVFEAAEGQRSGSAGRALAATVGAFALTEAGRQLARDRTVKTWRTTSGDPRASHAAMDGETVPIDSTFSNGLNWPGDPVMGPDEVAGCECTVDVSIE
ncbi:portal protein [Arthrobacter phage Kepler]|uniref:Portal protein n=4 Tax=Coralvirus TaxID=2733171 RepID=A0A3G2KFF0_9CAUD|nr:portal protein [Arthrobacter phage Coral]YP_009815834.1 portal protein [Arthrobacter phage Kepler]AYN57655.1 portal protein [Arthrobacter phage Daob]AYN58762.1 portal protein [Arthrobacter phage Polka]AYN57481.1 portal protein [Arthrobacter phage Coral]AYN58233.1 portal protein [Arthrobacter phage Kepler]